MEERMVELSTMTREVDHIVETYRGGQQEARGAYSYRESPGLVPFQAKMLASGGGEGDKCMKFWNTRTELPGHTSRVLYMTQSPDGCTEATAAGDETLSLAFV
ncbi:hypothetical protein DKX38_010417 [Salix brachista]|uniref:Uncharacterized protein n=1 Tax=Salix brachista TaxID=2182728 RepID=A0A5N5MG57_9ROSI|nr:hypothetical protein DKX38_010417 [Salix brachista]